MPLLTLLATGLVTGLVTVDFDLLYGLRMACLLVALYAYRTHYRKLAWGLRWEAVAIGVAIFGVWYLAAHGGDAAATRSLEQGLASLGRAQAVLWIAARVTGAVILIPIAEELAFRGYLLRRLVAADFSEVDVRKLSWFAWVVSSLAFGALHHDWLAATLAGLGYALAQQRHGRVTDAIVAHGVTNLLIAIDVLLLGHLRWWA
jgi:CAAX prenyl protease-like protein